MKSDTKMPSILAALGKGSESESETDDESEMGADEEHADAAQLIIDAIEKKDPTALTEALEAHYDLCRGD